MVISDEAPASSERLTVNEGRLPRRAEACG